jgi:hypothetical protein
MRHFVEVEIARGDGRAPAVSGGYFVRSVYGELRGSVRTMVKPNRLAAGMTATLVRKHQRSFAPFVSGWTATLANRGTLDTLRSLRERSASSLCGLVEYRGYVRDASGELRNGPLRLTDVGRSLLRYKRQMRGFATCCPRGAVLGVPVCPQCAEESAAYSAAMRGDD